VDTTKGLELLLALIAGGVITAALNAIFNRKKTTAEAKKIRAESDVALIDVALRMTDRLQQAMVTLELKTENLAKGNARLELDLAEMKIRNLNMGQEIELLKRRNDELEKTCTYLSKENNTLRQDLENCIKKD